MTKLWILSANSSRAALYAADSPTGALTQIESFENPDARAKQSDLSDDRPGRVYDSRGEGRHAMELEMDPKEREQLRFAKTLADMLEKGRVDHEFERVVLVASPAFLGMLRENLGDPMRATVSLEIDKDYSALRADELRARLPDRL